VVVPNWGVDDNGSKPGPNASAAAGYSGMADTIKMDYSAFVRGPADLFAME